MTKKSLNRDKKEQKRHKAETIIIKSTITKEQREVIQNLIGIIGSNEQDVVGKIITLWLYNEGFLNNKKLIQKNKDEK